MPGSSCQILSSYLFHNIPPRCAARPATKHAHPRAHPGFRNVQNHVKPCPFAIRTALIIWVRFVKTPFRFRGPREPKPRISVEKRCFTDSTGAIIWVRFEKRPHMIEGQDERPTTVSRRPRWGRFRHFTATKMRHPPAIGLCPSGRLPAHRRSAARPVQGPRQRQASAPKNHPQTPWTAPANLRREAARLCDGMSHGGENL